MDLSSFSLILKFEVYVDYLEKKPLLPLDSFFPTSEALKILHSKILEELLITLTMALASKSNQKVVTLKQNFSFVVSILE